MNEKQRIAIVQTALLPDGRRRLQPQDFAAAAGVRDPRTWALAELIDAIERRCADDVELAMQTGSQFGTDRDWVQPLIDVLDADWNHSHENAAFTLGQLQDRRAVPALVRATHWVPAYLDYDDGRGLAVKAIHSLGRLPGQEALWALKGLLNHEDSALRPRVQRVLQYRAADNIPND